MLAVEKGKCCHTEIKIDPSYDRVELQWHLNCGLTENSTGPMASSCIVPYEGHLNQLKVIQGVRVTNQMLYTSHDRLCLYRTN